MKKFLGKSRLLNKFICDEDNSVKISALKEESIQIFNSTQITLVFLKILIKQIKLTNICPITLRFFNYIN